MNNGAKSSTHTCQNPDCDDEATETYTDGFGNTLELCVECYFEAVHPSVPVRSIVSSERSEVEGGGIARRLFR